MEKSPPRAIPASAAPAAVEAVMSVPRVEQPLTRPNLAWVSWLRIVAITAVVLIHVAGLSAVLAGGRSTTVGRLGIVLDFSSRWAVPLFVMLSGALLLDPARYRGASHFMRRRALRLVPALVFWHLVYLGVVLTTRAHNDPATLLRLVITGKLWTALYFFWIVLGLALLTPLLVPWVATAGRRAQLVAAAAAYAVPLLTLITVPLRDAPISWMETAWTWWIPYLGYYLLGHALREVVVRGPMLVVPAVAAVAGTVLLIVQWRRSTGVLGALETYVPAESYYAPTVLVVTVSVFLLGRALVRPGGLLRALSTGATARVARRLGDATLGVFASHLLVLEVVLRLPVIGGPRGADSVGQLLARCVVVLLGAYVLALVASRLPLLRRVV